MNLAGYRPEIDGLRAVAVLLVIGYHYSLVDSVFASGFIGVDIFFVISGYLITRIIISGNFHGTWIREFYFRRVRRIFPVLSLVLLVTSLVALFLFLPFELRQLGKQVSTGALFSSNLLFWSETGYFDTNAIQKPLLHLWSLGIEEQFYLFYPLLLWATHKLRLSSFVVPLIVFLTSLLYLLSIGSSDPSQVYFSPFTRVWELALGGLFACIPFLRFPRVSLLVRSTGGLLIVSSIWLVEIQNSYPNLTSLYPIIGTAFVLIPHKKSDLVDRFLRIRILVLIGKLSYSLYLWHWPIISLYTISEGHPPTRWGKYVLLALTFFLSIVSYKLVELPTRQMVLSRINIARTSFILLLVAFVGISFSVSNGFPSRIQTKSGDSVSLKDVNNEFQTIQFSNPECLQNYPNPKSLDYKWWFCRTNKDSEPTLLLWGNSYANQYFSGFSSTGRITGESILSIGDCPIQREEDLVKPNPCAGSLFDEQNEFLMSIVKSQKSLKWVILAGLKETADSSDLRDLDGALGFLRTKNVETIVFHPHIKPKLPIFGCIGRPLRSPVWDCKLSRAEYLNFSSSFKSTSDLIRNKYPAVRLFDPNEAFCNESGCNFLIDGLPIIRDASGHLSDWGSQLVAQNFEEYLVPRK
jgi:peptidoglycan/LPS O-acetylase OafA/YrhL